jgi:hypothetical protein
MDTTATKDLERLEAEYLKRKRVIRENPQLSFEKKELAVRWLGLEYDSRRRELEEAV